MDILAKESGSPGGGIPSFLSTHPADEERSAALQKVIEELGQWEVEPLTLDWEAVRRDAEARIKK
jgi:predicted Zn-dependent protease